MKENDPKWILVLIVIFLGLIIFIRTKNCNYEEKLMYSLNHKNAGCTEATVYVRRKSRSSEIIIIRHFEDYDDSCIRFNLCSEFLIGSTPPKKFENTTFFVIYDKDDSEMALPIWTYKRYLILKKYFPESAKLVDTSLFE